MSRMKDFVLRDIEGGGTGRWIDSRPSTQRNQMTGKQQQLRLPSEIRAGDRLERPGGVVIIVDSIYEFEDNYRINYTWKDASVTSGFCYVAKNDRIKVAE